jgi:c-type cytochrome biogenesis protein CcmF
VSVICLVLFIICFLTDNFSIDAVARYSWSGQKIWYKLSAVWAGSAGSFLLWSSLVFWVIAICAGKVSTEDKKFKAVFLAVASAVCLGFAALLVFVERPFATATAGLKDGMGLNPLLQNFWMIIHPPLLFIGYAALAVPFATALAAVFADRMLDRTIYSFIRRWLLFGLIFLTAGIATGAKWSYIELGWGGWWAWDPVESTSLLPWLLSLAALHCITGTRFSESFKSWSLVLTPLAFIFSLIGTFITRSGILASVHSFDTNIIFSALLLFIACCFALWIIATSIVLTQTESSKSQTASSVFSRVGLLKTAIFIFVFSSIVILIGTFWPLISKIFTGPDYSVVLTRAFYDRFIAAAALVSAILLGLFGLKDLTKRAALIGKLSVCAGISGLVFLFVFLYLKLPLLISLIGGLVSFPAGAIFIKNPADFKRSKLTSADITHLGFLLLTFSAAFSSCGKSCQKSLAKNESFKLGKFVIGYESFEHKMSDNLTQAGPVISVKTKGIKQILWPHKNVYSSGQDTSEMAVLTRLFGDLYVTFDGTGTDGKVLISAKTKPFMFWLWLAMLLLTLGPAMVLFSTKKSKINFT